MTQLTRRSFLKKSALAAAATITISGTKSSGRVIGANDTIRIGVAGLNGRGGAHVGAWAGMKNVQITHLIDPDTRTWKNRIKQATAKNGGPDPKTMTDIRTALEDKDLDAVSVATPNHWHALITIWACQAGKDVYVEKPCSHNVFEGRVAVEMARKHNRIVQHGTQNRGMNSWAKLLGLVKSGQLGKLKVSRALCYKNRPSIGIKAIGAAPSEVDFNIWQGPAQEHQFHGNLVHYNWHWFWDFGNGDIGNQGVHQMDVARWLIPGAKLPKSVLSVGGRFGYKDQGETPNTQISVMDFGETQLIFEVRGLPTKKFYDQTVGNILHFEAGIVSGNNFYPKDSPNVAKPLPEVKEFTPVGPGGDIFGNFIQCMRTRKVDELQADILEAHYSSTLCHLANISYRVGAATPFAELASSFKGNDAALESLERAKEHLAVDNELTLKNEPAKAGKFLKFDGETERFIDDKNANALLTREYRAPFIVPSNVG